MSQKVVSVCLNQKGKAAASTQQASFGTFIKQEEEEGCTEVNLHPEHVNTDRLPSNLMTETGSSQSKGQAQELKLLKQEVTTLENLYRNLSDDKTALDNKCIKLDIENRLLKKQVEKGRENFYLTALQQFREHLNKIQQTNSNLTAQVKSAQSELTSTKSGLEEKESEIYQLQGQVDSLRLACTDVAKENHSLNEQLLKSQDDFTKMQQENSILTDQLQSVRLQLDSALNEATFTKSELELKLSEIVQLRAQLESTQKDKSVVTALLEQTNSNLVTEKESLHAQVNRLNDEIDTLTLKAQQQLDNHSNKANQSESENQIETRKAAALATAVVNQIATNHDDDDEMMNSDEHTKQDGCGLDLEMREEEEQFDDTAKVEDGKDDENDEEDGDDVTEIEDNTQVEGSSSSGTSVNMKKFAKRKITDEQNDDDNIQDMLYDDDGEGAGEKNEEATSRPVKRTRVGTTHKTPMGCIIF